MIKDDIIRMAQEAGISKPWDQEPVQWETLERFAKLVVAAERERIIAANAPEIEKVNVYIKALKDAVAAEREACAYLCDRVAEENRHVDEQAELCAFVIRERGAP